MVKWNAKVYEYLLLITILFRLYLSVYTREFCYIYSQRNLCSRHKSTYILKEYYKY